MLSVYRSLFFNIFAIFYIVSLPFLIILSLGYDLSLKNQNFSNALTVHIESTPRNAEIKTKNVIYKTPTELKIPQNQVTSLTIQSPNFLSETMIFSGNLGENTAARVDNLWMLPRNPNNIFGLQDFKGLNILSPDLLLLQKEKQYFVQSYGFSGIENKALAIQNSNNIIINTGNWERLLENTFWKKDQNLILHQDANKNWQFVDLKVFNPEFVSVAKISNFEIILLDTDQILWLLDLNTQVLSFLDKGYQGLAFTDSPDTIWLLSDDTIFNPKRSNLGSGNFNPQSDIYARSSIFKSNLETNKVLTFDNFLPKSVFLGIIFKIQDSLLYLADSNKSNIQIIARDVSFLSSQNSTVFWLNKDQDFFAYNFFLKQRNYFGKISSQGKDIRIAYFSRWRRIFIYDDKEVISFWYDTEVTNKSIINYSPNSWIQSRCLPQIQDNYQFCINEKELLVYKNNSIPW